MCGIVGAISQRPVQDILIEGLRRLEYRGYDSAGVAIINPNNELKRIRSLGKVQDLCDSLAKEDEITGTVGIAHTRWATHGQPSVANAHPHVSGSIALVHNGIIENFAELKTKLNSLGYEFTSETDTEVIVHLVHYYRQSTSSLLEAVQKAVKELKGAYAIAVIDANEPNNMVVSRSGSPLVIGFGINEHFVASDQLALLSVTRRFAYLENGDVALLSVKHCSVYDINGNKVDREVKECNLMSDASDKQGFKHYMLKEIHEQPKVVCDILRGRIEGNSFNVNEFGLNAEELFKKAQSIQIVACGTSYHAGLVAKNWIEEYLSIPCLVDIASEYRYKKNIVLPNCLFITISQSGETADTLAALRLAKTLGYLGSLAIFNVDGSSLVRESDLSFMTRAGAEIGVASTKAFIAQLVSFLVLTGSMMSVRTPNNDNENFPNIISNLISDLRALPYRIEEILKCAPAIENMAQILTNKTNAIFLGRGWLYPIAMEGALKLKEISYIHAEAYAAGELKHGPVALIDSDMPVICVTPSNKLLDKIISNIQVVKARKGETFIVSDNESQVENIIPVSESNHILQISKVSDLVAPIVFTIPLQLLSYYVALLRGYDVDQPRNLAKSVTVE